MKIQFSLDDDWQQVQWKRRHQFAEFVPLKAHNLTTLLEEKWFLSMVLEHLAEYGLQECRMVCWRWYEVCQQFQVKLKQIPPERLEQVVSAFPNATSMSVVEASGRKASDVKVFEYLSSLHSLKSLKLHPSSTLLAGSAQPYLQLIPWLTRLDIVLDNSDGVEEMIGSIKCLTGLTRLQLIGGVWHSKIGAFSSLEKIRELEIEYDLFTDEMGTCCFPSLTNLTRLELVSDCKWAGGRLFCIEALSHYTSSLQYLSLRIDWEPIAISFMPLTTLINLKTLEVGNRCAWHEDFWTTLRGMCFISRLQIRAWGCMSTPMTESIARLTGLEALDCEELFMHDYDANDIPLASTMTHLKELAISVNGTLIPKLKPMVHLVHLNLSVYSDYDCTLNDALSCMTKLQTLCVKLRDCHDEELATFCGSLSVSSDALSNTTRLESLSLESVCVDKLFFQQLAPMRELRKLEFKASVKRTYSQSFLSQVNLLKNLEELTLRLGSNCNVCKLLFPGRLSKLKKLTVDGDEEDVISLRRRFAALPQAQINPKESPWLCNRLIT